MIFNSEEQLEKNKNKTCSAKAAKQNLPKIAKSRYKYPTAWHEKKETYEEKMHI